MNTELDNVPTPPFTDGFRQAHAALDALFANLTQQDARISAVEALARSADARAAAWEGRAAELRKIASDLAKDIAMWRRPWAWMILVGVLSGTCAWALLFALTGKR